MFHEPRKLADYHSDGNAITENLNRPPEPSARRAVQGVNPLRATPCAISRPRQKKPTIRVLQNRTSLKTRDIAIKRAIRVKL